MTGPKKADQQPQAAGGWRFYVGLVLFVLHLILPFLALLVVPFLGVSAGISAVIYSLSVAGGPDVLLIASAAIMGKENLQYLFSLLGGWFKRLIKWDQVSSRRYRVGLWLMTLSVIVTTVLFYFFPRTLLEGDQLGWGYFVTVGADIVFIISFFVLGAEFWAKIRALFQYKARVEISE